MGRQVRKMKRHHKKASKRNPKAYALTQSYDRKLLDKIRRYYDKLLEVSVSSCQASMQQQSGNKELIKLKSWFKGNIIRDKILLNKFSAQSATLIQANWRGHHVRKALASEKLKNPKSKKKKAEETKVIPKKRMSSNHLI